MKYQKMITLLETTRNKQSKFRINLSCPEDENCILEMHR